MDHWNTGELNTESAAEFEVVLPSASPVIQSLRALGYLPETAVADIVDNSLDAGATKIWIDIVWADENSYVRIADNGDGLDEETLVQAMRLGSKDPRDERRHHELGRFGMGLKTASFSLGKRLTVWSRQNGRENIRCWDLDEVLASNEWKLRRSAFDDSLKALGTIPGETGTVVLIEKLDRLAPPPYTDRRRERFFHQITVVEKHLQMVFHRFLERHLVEIVLNGNSLVPWDPFSSRLPFTQELPKEDLVVNGKRISIQGYVLPHHSRLSGPEYQEMAGPNDWFDQQGFYVYRNLRLLVAGGWLGLFPKDQPSQLGRIRVDIDETADFDWQIDVRKSIARPPQEVVGHLKRWGEQVRRLSHRAYYYRGKSGRTGKKSKELTRPSDVWVKTIQDGTVRYEIDLHHPLLSKLREQCTDEGRKLLDVYLKTLQEFNPGNKVSFRPELQTTGEEIVITESDRKEIAAIGSIYTELMSAQEAALELKAMPQFARYALPEILRVVREGVR